MSVRSLFVVFLAAGALSACETVVDVAVPEHTPQLVVHGFFSPDSVWAVRLDRSADITGLEDVRGLFVPHATVSVADATGSFSETLAHAGGGIYQSISGSRPVPGVAYTLRAETPGLPAVQAVSSVPAATASIVELGRLDTSKTLVEVYIDSFGNREEIYSSGRYRARFRITDPPGPNYYKIELFQWSPIGEERFTGYRPVEDEPGNPAEFREISFGSNDTSFRGDDYAYFFDEPELDGEYDFYGALFADELFEGKTKEFEITFTARSFDTVESRYELEFSVLSADYFTYHHTALLQGSSLDGIAIETALLQTPPTPLHSNIEQGLGVFAGYAVHTFGFDGEGNVWSGEER
ncbi:MAG: DUF4249 domain-containing protein [Bacteroidetes bacterium SB0662_bin_6]|nr:DUF4249 domain-containing protein [Bacteroidetes bacterium SB0668_bin_1]MYE04070.1 DUF4249 domain-containing protein [Bacteroidetes bacterium SB0662_bin_6]